MLPQVLERIKDPLQTMISRDRFETAYAVLTNFLIIVQRAPLIFSQVNIRNVSLECILRHSFRVESKKSMGLNSLDTTSYVAS